MRDEPTFVADPREPRPRPRLARWRPAVTAAAVLVLLAAIAWLLFTLLGQQDPALEVGWAGAADTGRAIPFR